MNKPGKIIHSPIIEFNKREYKKLNENQYSKEKYRLQVELLKLQEWVIAEKKRVALVFEGRDTAGKGSTIKRFIEHLIPKGLRVVALGVPTPKESKFWFRRYEKEMPKPGEIVFFDRSWYNRAIVEPTMGYCTEQQYKYFLRKVNTWEHNLIQDDGIELIKFYLSVSKEKQIHRMIERIKSPLKYWKFSENDRKSIDKFQLFTFYKNQMFDRTSTELAPWVVIDSNKKMIARLNAIRYVLNYFDYSGKQELKEMKWTRETHEYRIKIDGVVFDGLDQQQYEILLNCKEAMLRHEQDSQNWNN